MADFLLDAEAQLEERVTIAGAPTKRENSANGLAGRAAFSKLKF
jgi:hypothetical protein